MPGHAIVHAQAGCIASREPGHADTQASVGDMYWGVMWAHYAGQLSTQQCGSHCGMLT